MKQYVCKKKSSFGGKMYFPGDIIPLEAVDPDREKKLISYGKIAIVESADEPEEVTANALESDNQQPEGQQPEGQQPETKEEKPRGKKGEK